MKKNIIIIVLITVFLVVVFFLDWPLFKQTSSLRDEIKSYNKLIEERKELIAKVEQLKDIYEDRQTDINKVYYALPQRQEIPELIVQLEALASENGLILESLDIKEKKRATETNEKKAAVSSQINILEISLALSGSYPAFKGFLEALEYNVRIMDVQKIEFSFKKGQEEGAAFLGFNLDLLVYYQ